MLDLKQVLAFRLDDVAAKTALNDIAGAKRVKQRSHSGFGVTMGHLPDRVIPSAERSE
jgi:hypothetical protein